MQSRCVKCNVAVLGFVHIVKHQFQFFLQQLLVARFT